jgi:hypothetical protein
MPYESIVKPVNSPYGAPMGRHTGAFIDTCAGKLYLRRIRINSGGYDAGGAYWGLGAPLYECQDQDGNTITLRARNRDEAKRQIAQEWEGARFYK